MRTLVQHVDVIGIDEIAADQDVLLENATISSVAAGGSVSAADVDAIVDGFG